MANKRESLFTPIRQAKMSMQESPSKEIDKILFNTPEPQKEDMRVEAAKGSSIANVKESPKAMLAREIQSQQSEVEQELPEAPKPQVDLKTKEQTSKGLSRGFTDALMYFGPRIGAMLIGGADAMEVTDKVMTGYDAYVKQQSEQARLQEELAAKEESERQARLLKDREYLLRAGNLEQRKAEYEEQKRRTSNLQEERDLKWKEVSMKKAIDFRNTYAKSPTAKKFKEQMAFYDKFEELLTTGKKIPDITLSIISKSIGGETGVLTDRDIERAQVNVDFVSSLKRGAYKKFKGILPPEDVAELRKIAAALKAKEKERAINDADLFAKSRAKFLSEEDRQVFRDDLLREGLRIEPESKKISEEELINKYY